MKIEFEKEDTMVEAFIEETLQKPEAELTLEESVEMALKGMAIFLKHIEDNGMQCPDIYNMALNINRAGIYAKHHIANRKLH